MLYFLLRKVWIFCATFFKEMKIWTMQIFSVSRLQCGTDFLASDRLTVRVYGLLQFRLCDGALRHYGWAIPAKYENGGVDDYLLHIAIPRLRHDAGVPIFGENNRNCQLFLVVRRLLRDRHCVCVFYCAGNEGQIIGGIAENVGRKVIQWKMFVLFFSCFSNCSVFFLFCK